jgi:hypothetical protein
VLIEKQYLYFVGTVKKNPILFILAFFILYLSVLTQISAEVQNEDTKKTTENNKSVELIARTYKWEFSFAVSIGLKMEPWIDNSLTSSLTMAFPARIGYFIERNLEIEPEINFALETDPSKINTLFLGNLVYNFNSSSKLTPFVLGGFGKDCAEIRISFFIL